MPRQYKRVEKTNAPGGSDSKYMHMIPEIAESKAL